LIELTWSTIPSLRNVIFILFLLRWTKKSYYVLRGHGIIGTLSLVYSRLYKAIYKLLLRAPGVRSQVDKQVATAITDIENKIAPQGPGVTRYLTIPKEPWTPEQLKAELAQLAEMKRTRWEDGKVSGAVYHGGEELLHLQAMAMETFGVANPIHPDVFPGVRKMEAEVVAMV
jgi:sphinganine-1-phosphate aldolase